MDTLRTHFEPFGLEDTTTTLDSTSRPIRIFMLHGSRVVESLHEMLLERHSTGLELFYPNGPHSASKDTWTWGAGDFESEVIIRGLDTSIKKIMDVLMTHGPFDGIMGFSTGAAVAAIITSILERGTRSAEGVEKIQHPPFRFAVCFSGFRLEHPSYRRFYSPRIQAPVLHFEASYDTMIPGALTDKLVEACLGCDVQVFEGTHCVPRRRDEVLSVGNFVMQRLGCAQSESKVC
ncbi:serine hydrolase FSH [Aspergillus aurantiobrunneus]